MDKLVGSNLIAHIIVVSVSLWEWGICNHSSFLPGEAFPIRIWIVFVLVYIPPTPTIVLPKPSKN